METADGRIAMTAPETLTRSDAEAFLYYEARLLDERKFDAWLALFEDDARYLVPIEDDDNPLEPMIINDDRARLSERIFRLQHTRAYAQFPPSQTVRMISNVEVEAGASATFVLRCNVLISEMRMGDDGQSGLGVQRSLAARCTYLVRPGSSHKILEKKVLLLNRNVPIYNLTMML